MTWMTRLAVTTAAVMLTLAGCGGDGGGPASETPQVPDGPPESTFVETRTCLEAAGFKTLGGPKPAGDEDAPAYELIVRDGGGGPGGMLAIYATEDEALQRRPGIEDNLAQASEEGAGGSAEAFGSVLVL